MAFEPDTDERFRELRAAVEAGDEERTRRLHEDLFGGDPTNAKRFFTLTQMQLAGLGTGFMEVNGAGGEAQIQRTEKERKKFEDAVWHSLILSEHIRVLEARLEDLNRRIADLTFKIEAKEKEIAAFEEEKSKLETQKAQAVQELNEAETRIEEIEDTYIPDLEKAIRERNEAFDQLIERQNLSPEEKQAYRDIRAASQEVVTVGIKLPGDPDLDPPPKHIVHRNEEGKLYVLDKEGNIHILPEESPEYESAMRQIAKGEKIGNQLDPEKLEAVEKAHRIYYEAIENNPELRAANRKASNENLRENRIDLESIEELKEEKTKLEDKVKTLRDQISGYDARIAELEEKIRLGKIEIEEMKAEREKLTLERDDVQKQLEEAKLKQRENINEIQEQTRHEQLETARLNAITALVDSKDYSTNIERFIKGEIGLDRLFENAPPALKAKIQDPALRVQLENIAFNESLSPTKKAELITYISTATREKQTEPASKPVKTNEEFSQQTMPSLRSPDAGQLIPIFNTPATGTPLMSPAVDPNMSPARIPSQNIIGSTP